MHYLNIFCIVCIAFVTIVNAIKGEIKSCSGWKLNGLPEVKRFIKTTGHADSYQDLTINFIRGHAPVLIIQDDTGKEIEKIDLATYTTDQLVSILFICLFVFTVQRYWFDVHI